MSTNDASVATAALVIAISAFIIACGQLLQQLFATADGLRRCQASVIGEWSELVQLRFRWSSFRFEVRVTTPHLDIVGPSPNRVWTSKLKDGNGYLMPRIFVNPARSLCSAATPVGLVGTSMTCRLLVSSSKYDLDTEETVTWISLINDIYRSQCVMFEESLQLLADRPTEGHELRNFGLEKASLVCFTRKTRSWDFMPPEMVRPVASTTIGCIISLVHRLGMNWVELKPDEAIVRASGNGRSISTSRVRGLGLVVEYNSNGSSLGMRPLRDLSTSLYLDGARYSDAYSVLLRIPSRKADKMACGILPGVHLPRGRRLADLHLRDTRLPVITQISRAFDILQLDEDTRFILQQSLTHKHSAHILPSFADLLGLWTDNLVLPNIYVNIVESPFPIQINPMGGRPESRAVWRWYLRNRIRTPVQPHKQPLDLYEEWASKEPGFAFYGCESDHRVAIPEITYYESILDQTMSYFGQFSDSFYEALIRAHINVNSQSLNQADENIRTGRNQPRPRIPRGNTLYQGDPIFTERAFLYAENLEKIVASLNPTRFGGYGRVAQIGAFSTPCNGALEPDIEEAWWMLMLRMQAWNMIHNVVHREGVTAPHHYYDDPSRVYIL
ncbi:hypothetical protein CC86DRAFT_58612 [Ophiobolus disseminans]|uniref:Uncharacterized protein n=1 Tax=Ophiobolus disseminans TaxID=1469910 RepID=A0A6A6ZTC2_9PLEO|nr:hypothetical protein CC86DRAFT_58612 [Ophiobolus disseminans]